MTDQFTEKALFWVAGLLFSLVQAWSLVLYKGGKQNHENLEKKVDENQKHNSGIHGKIFEKVNDVSSRMDREFVHKDDMREIKKEMRDGFKKLEDLIKAN